MAAKSNPTLNADDTVRQEMARRALRQSMTNLGYPGGVRGSVSVGNATTRDLPFVARPAGMDSTFGRLPAPTRQGRTPSSTIRFPQRSALPAPTQLPRAARPPMTGAVNLPYLRPFADDRMARTRALTDYLRSLGGIQ